MPPFNLIDSPWIPVRNLDGTNRLVSLGTLFREAASIADLDCPPHERIALTRLLVGITQAELGAPDSPDDWDEFGTDLETRIPATLQRPDVHPHFDLFGDGPRFLQTQPPSGSITYPIDQIIAHFATGNNPTLLDHAGGTPRHLRPDQIARAILAYQNFFVGGTMAAKVKGNGPALNYLHCILIGDNLLQSILLNCVDKELLDNHYEGIGKPSWKSDSTATLGFLDRLVPFHCSLWISSNPTRIHIEAGRQSLRFPEQRDPFATTRAVKDNRFLVRADFEKGLWRDLHVITVLRTASAQEQQAPLNLQSHAHEYANQSARIWLGEFIKGEKATIIDSVESTFTVPSSLFTGNGRGRYAAGVEFADRQSNQLYGAIKQYGATLNKKTPPTDRAKQHYWHALEQRCQLLLEIVASPEPLAEDFGIGQDVWTGAVRSAALAAFEKTCPRQTPRQMRAFATGLRVLRPKIAKPKLQPSAA